MLETMLSTGQNRNYKSHDISDRLVVNNKFRIAVPHDWRDKTVYCFEGPQEDGIKHQITVTIDNNVAIQELAQYANLQMNVMENELRGYMKLKQGEIQLLNGVPAYEVVYKWYPTPSRKIYQRVIYILINNTGYMLIATFSKKTWKIKGEELGKILMSFSIPDEMSTRE